MLHVIVLEIMEVYMQWMTSIKIRNYQTSLEGNRASVHRRIHHSWWSMIVNNEQGQLGTWESLKLSGDVV
jgi:uncharacterized membrane protein